MIYLYLFGTCFHFIYVFMIIGKELFRVDFGVFDNRCMPKFRIFARERSSPILFP